MGCSEKLPTLLSLCSGYGGLEQGIRLAGCEHRVVAHVEIEAFAVANLVDKMEKGALDPSPIWTDIKTLPVEPFRNRIDILAGGYPCQPFSTAGNMRGQDDPRHLWPYFASTIDSIKPLRCFFENVEGHITRGLRNVITDLVGMGYRVAWGIFSAEEVGASHKRKRIFIMADSDCCRRNENTKQCKQGCSRAVQPSGYSGKMHEREIRQICEWPAKPEQKQHCWEEPRIIKPSVGRAANGSAKRLDRLRLLGNGVVPQTAALAWRSLSEKLCDCV